VNALRRLILLCYFVAATLPLGWMVVTSIKRQEDAISLNPQKALVFSPSTDGFRRLSEVHVGAEESFWEHLRDSTIIGLCSTLLSVALGTLAAYGFSRHPIPGSKDWLFFILSTRFMPPLAVVVPVLFMYRELGLQGTHVGLILLYTAFNLSLSVWLMKGFIDEIPRAFEEAALVDGYTRLQAFRRVILPQARTGMAVTAVFCLISAWNEYGFAMTLNSSGALTVPAYFAGLQGNLDGMPWPQVAAGALIFVAPIVVFTIVVRKHLLRGMTFGTIKQ
jgi:multiple sugar transport system permease protein